MKLTDEELAAWVKYFKLLIEIERENDKHEHFTD
jgi:hypothetical protein